MMSDKEYPNDKPDRQMLNKLDDLSADDWMRIQELSRRSNLSSSDWIAMRIRPELKDHDCFKGGCVDHRNFETSDLGDHDDWEFSVKQCKTCRHRYLRAFLESDGMPKSARWYIGRLAPETLEKDIRPSSALRILAQYDRLFYGGSFWAHTGKWSEHINNFRDLSRLRVMDDS